MVLIGHVARGPGFEATLAAGQSIAHAEEYVYTFFNPDRTESEVVHPLDTLQIPKAVALTKEAGDLRHPDPRRLSQHRAAGDVARRTYLRNPDLALPRALHARTARRRPQHVRHAALEGPSAGPSSATSSSGSSSTRCTRPACRSSRAPTRRGSECRASASSRRSRTSRIVGFTPYAALRRRRSDAARLLQRENEFGTITVGKRADFVLSGRTRSTTCATSARRAGVMVDGRWIPDSERRRMIESLPAAYASRTFAASAPSRRRPPALTPTCRQRPARRPLRGGAPAASSRRAARSAVVEDASGGSGTTHPESPLLGRGHSEPARLRPARPQEWRRGDRDLPPQHRALSEVRQRLRQPRRDVPRRGDKEGARQNYAKALEVDPDYGNATAAREILKTAAP